AACPCRICKRQSGTLAPDRLSATRAPRRPVTRRADCSLQVGMQALRSLLTARLQPPTGMKALRSLLTASLLAAASTAPASAPAQITIDIDVFRERLSPYGRWVDDDRFGEVWFPRNAHEWRPYSNGRWVFTDEYGWLWVEEDEWGWATEHYGHWLWDDDRGWFWIPGFEWAPAWVRWRGDDRYIGWSPLPPPGFERLHAHDRRRWVFVDSRRFVEPNVRTVIIGRDRYDDLLRRVPLRGEVKRAERFWENRAFDDAWVARVAGRPVPRLRVRDVER